MIIRIDTYCGYRTEDTETGEIKYYGGNTWNGYCYKDMEAYKSGKGVCYVDEYGLDDNEQADHDRQYTRADFLMYAENNEEAADDLFEGVTWQSLDALVNEGYLDAYFE